MNLTETTFDGRYVRRDGGMVETFSPLALRYRVYRPLEAAIEPPVKILHGNDKRCRDNYTRVHSVMRRMTGRV